MFGFEDKGTMHKPWQFDQKNGNTKWADSEKADRDPLVDYLELWQTNIGNAYLKAKTKEKVYVIAGPEFGKELEGHHLVIVRALYGLKTSGLRWHERFADVLREMEFTPCPAEPDIWMRDMRDH